ncbi:sensor histidine kinase [Agromyces aerolatus]|uniref:sensor histidine kinase n=1 Tax=Agromyces sp. LY-1074 TaxID=3074080 RepID=UPI00285D6880|nr:MULTISPECIES: ATP-binding protein [unclassified Agromyces]MDR5698235.1 ATP-binding protein [Agromyces sp. LY-1074]MDR5704529.1 ATP-binding protein [Agromyces sp. LY-1358]
MESTWLVLAALAFGVFLGAAFMVVLHMAERRGSAAARVVAPTVPDGVDQVLDVLESAGVVLDPSNNVLRASPGALAMGLVRGQSLVHDELIQLAGNVRRTGERVDAEIVLARGFSGAAQLRLHVRVARLGTRFVLMLADDRTEAYRLDEVRRDFVANISHELKTPIASVSLLSEAIDLAADEPEQVRRFANRLSVESARLGHITKEVIELSRLQAHDALRPDELVDVDEVCRAAVEHNRVVAGAKHIEVAIKAKSRAKVWGDRALLTVAVDNLIANAIAYSNDGGRVGVGVRAEGGIVEIAVTDQGIGLAEEDLDRVFERFYRVDQARSRNTGGSGLGLSIVKHTVQNLGGDVRVWSRLGHGATFTIRLPIAEQGEAIEQANEAGAAGETSVPPTDPQAATAVPTGGASE